MNGRQFSANYAAVQNQKLMLPARQAIGDFLRKLTRHQVVFVDGQPGSGKTTQITQAAALWTIKNNLQGRTVVTQPRRAAALGTGRRLAVEMDVEFGEEVGLWMKNHSQFDATDTRTWVLTVTEGMLLNAIKRDRELRDYSVIIIDEVHERSSQDELIMGHLGEVERPDLKVILMSATGDLDQLRQWFGSTPDSMITLPSIRHRREIIHATTPASDYRLDICRRVHEVLQNQSKYEKGDILIFVPGVEEIREVMDRVKHIRDGCEPSAQVHALYRDQTKSQQDQVMADTQPSPLRPRKIIVATNIAETSLTFPFLNIVIDTGLVKVNSYDPTHGVEWLLLKSVSKAQADQRAGRVGRTRPGFVFRLYTLNSYVRFDQYPAPAITRESFDSSLLAWLAMGHRDVARDALPALPSRQHRLRAVDNLRLLGALKPSFELTVHGEQMSRLPVKPMIAKMILESRKFGTQLTAINLAAVLSAEKILDKIRNLDRDIGALHARFRDPQGDHFTLLNVFQAYESTRLDRQWSQVNFINTQGCEEALAMRDTIKQLIQVMYPEWQMKLREPDSPDYIEKIGKTLLAGFFPNLVSIQRTRGTYQTVRDGSGDSLHPERLTSVSHRPEYMIFTKLRPHPFKHQTLMSEVSAVDHAWIKEVVPAVSGVSSHDYKLKRSNMYEYA